MPANVMQYTGRQAAWHQLGKVTGRYQTLEEILTAGGLNFGVFKRQLEFQGVKIPAWGTFRADSTKLFKDSIDVSNGKPVFLSMLGTVGEDYNVVQHLDGLKMVDSLMGQNNGAHYETAGVLGRGEVVWGLADLGLSINIRGDESKPFLLFATSHDGSYSYVLKMCIERVVCQNTLNVALAEKTTAQFKIRHTKSANDRIIEAHKALAAFSDDVHSIEYRLNFLAGRKMVRESYQRVMDRLFPVREKDGKPVDSTRRDNILSTIAGIYESNDNNAFPEQRGTAYNLLNAVTNFVDHERTSKNDGRAESALFGSGEKLKTQALNLILDEAKGLIPVDFSLIPVVTRQ